MSLPVRLKYNVSQSIFDSLEFVNNRIWCTIESRVGIVQARTDKRMRYKRCSVGVKSMSDVAECFNMVVAGL